MTIKTRISYGFRAIRKQYPRGGIFENPRLKQYDKYDDNLNKNYEALYKGLNEVCAFLTLYL